MKEFYTNAKIEIVEFSDVDIIRTSGQGAFDGPGYELGGSGNSFDGEGDNVNG